MRSIVYTYFAVLIFVLASCGNKTPENTVQSFYTQQLKVYDFRKPDSSFLSADINNLILEVVGKENKSADQLKSIQSTDKPDIMEGDIFTSNYEGAQSFKILSVQKNENDAIVKVEFTYENKNWIDDILLKFENNQWLIVDIQYGQSYLQGSLLKSLHAFLNDSKHQVGGDKDQHGCLGSAGYTWSYLKQTCIRSFELPIQLLNPEATTTSGLHFSNDGKQAELFLPDGPISLQQINNDQYKYLVDRKTVGVLNRDNNKWEFYIVGSDLVYKQK